MEYSGRKGTVPHSKYWWIGYNARVQCYLASTGRQGTGPGCSAKKGIEPNESTVPERVYSQTKYSGTEQVLTAGYKDRVQDQQGYIPRQDTATQASIDG